jgi:phosphoribosylformimino-5-aminoimidazole carboxamide ribonucleotide (ProFAR) isomerase
MDLYPAIDLLGGRVVRLRQGDYADETVYGDDPVAVAREFAAAGAPWIHVVDLDAARSGDPVNRPVVAAVAAAVDGQDARPDRRWRAFARRRLGTRCRRRRPGRDGLGGGARARLVEAASEIVPVAVGLDHRDGEVAVHGWTEGSGLMLDHAFALFPSAEVFVITDIGRDGMLVGPDIDGLTKSAELAGSPVIASGGVSGLADVLALARIPNLGGIITGKAVYEGRFTVAEALEALAQA